MSKKIIISSTKKEDMDMDKIFEIRTLNNKREDFMFLAKLQEDVLTCEEKRIILSFEKCKFSHAIFTSFIGALTEICKEHGKRITYRFLEDSASLNYFKKSGMCDYMTNDESLSYTNSNALPFWKVDLDDDVFMNYIDSIIGLSHLNILDEAKQKLFKNLYELFVNASEHSHEKNGVFSCGHWMPRNKNLVFSIYDTGIGICDLVKNKIDNTMSKEDALKWALVDGNSTKQLIKGVPRGVGLSDLKKFIALNNGRLTIMSNGVYYDFSSEHGETIEKFKYNTIGTMVCITIMQDEEYIYK